MKILKKHIKTNQNITTTRYVFGPVCVLKKISSKTFNKTFLFGIRIGYKNKIIENKLNFCELFSTRKTEPDFPIDIIVPVYNGYEYLDDLFTSIYENTDLKYHLIVVNDASPDERVLPLLKKYKKQFGKKMTLINNPENLGFIKSVNSALSQTTNHVALINTDVILPKNWASKLFTPIYLDNMVATVTPFSNNATIFSLPKILENDLMGDLDLINCELSKINTPFEKIKLPTGVGFCMAMNKNAIKSVGYFDTIFGRGYCEENDWCMRAINRGYYNTIAANMLVWHKHGASFGPEKQKLIQQNEKKLLDRHPTYNKFVQKTLCNNYFMPLRFIGELLYLSVIDKSKLQITITPQQNEKYILTYKYNDLENSIILSTTEYNELLKHLK